MSTTLGRWRLGKEIGRGSFGVVWEATSETGERAAIKLVHPSLSGDPAFAAAVRRESRALARLDHPGIIKLLEVVEVPGHLGIVLELLSGEDLHERLQRGALPTAAALQAVEQIAGALAFAHRAAVVHRDIKPSNVFLLDEGALKLLDFGVARAAEGTVGSASGQFTGTYSYAAPEIWLGKPTTTAVDVYAFGLLAWELFSGRPACPDGALPSKMSWHLQQEPPPLSASGVASPAWIDTLIRRCVAKAPGERLPDGSAIVALLRSLRGEEGNERSAYATRPSARAEGTVVPRRAVDGIEGRQAPRAAAEVLPARSAVKAGEGDGKTAGAERRDGKPAGAERRDDGYRQGTEGRQGRSSGTATGDRADGQPPGTAGGGRADGPSPGTAWDGRVGGNPRGRRDGNPRGIEGRPDGHPGVTGSQAGHSRGIEGRDGVAWPTMDRRATSLRYGRFLGAAAVSGVLLFGAAACLGLGWWAWPGASPAADAPIGVAACDAFVAKYRECLAVMEPSRRDAAEGGLDALVAAWRTTGATAEGRAGLELGCPGALLPPGCPAVAEGEATERAEAVGAKTIDGDKAPDAAAAATVAAVGDDAPGQLTSTADVAPPAGASPAGSSGTPAAAKTSSPDATSSAPSAVAKTSSPNPPSSNPEAPTVATKLPSAQAVVPTVDVLLTANKGVKICFVKDMKETGEFPTGVVLRVIVQPSGKASSAKVTSATGRGIDACLSAAAMAITYPPFEGSALTRDIPFVQTGSSSTTSTTSSPTTSSSSTSSSTTSSSMSQATPAAGSSATSKTATSSTTPENLPTAKEVTSVVDTLVTNNKGVRICFIKDMKETGEFPSGVVLRLTVQPDGTGSAKVTSPTGRGLDGCLAAAAKAIVYPRFEGTAIVRDVPFVQQ